MEVIQVTNETAELLRELKQRVKEEHGRTYAYSDFIYLALRKLKDEYERDHGQTLIELEGVRAMRLAKKRFLRGIKKREERL